VARIEFLRRELPLPAGDVYLYETFTRPAERGLGISGAAGTRLAHDLAAEGLRRIVAAVLPENPAGVRAYEKAGYRRRGTIGYVRLGPVRREFLRVKPH
jgi:RimJ/RimL family protein N-acetyltransferase